MPPGGNRNTAARAKNFKGSALRLIKEFKPQRVILIIVMIFVAISSAIIILSPVFLNVVTRTLANDMGLIGSAIAPGGDLSSLPASQAGFSLEHMIYLDPISQTLSLNWGFLWFYFGIIIGFYVVSSIVMFISDWIIVKISANYAYSLRKRIKEKLDRLPLSYFDNNLFGDVLSRGTNDVDQISRSMQQIINQTLSAITTFIGVLIAMFIVSWQLTLVALVILPLSLVASLLIMKLSQKRFVAARVKTGELNGIIEESYSGFRVIKLYNMEKKIGNDFNVVNKELATADRWSQWLSSFIFPSLRFIGNLGFVGVCLVSGLISKDNPGIIADMISFFMFLNIFQQPFQQLGQISAQIQATVAAAERIFELLDEKEETSDEVVDINEALVLLNKIIEKSQEQSDIRPLLDQFKEITSKYQNDTSLLITKFDEIGQALNDNIDVIELLEELKNILYTLDVTDDDKLIQGEYDIRDVDFSYTDDKELIKGLNLDVHKGESVAIVGPTGAGKTTIVNLLMRFYEIDGGSIKLDGRDIKNYTRRALRDSVGMVLQDTWLFSGSIRDNVRYGNENATDEEIENACIAASADHFIRTLPGGYDFKLSEDGANISQGQRQLLTIARALVSNPQIVILDEATSSVDTRTEIAVQDAMNKMMEGKTSFVIAHRLSTIKNAKTILVMNKGKIVEKGNHKELLKLNGFYADLYNAQFSGSNPLAPKEEEETT